MYVDVDVDVNVSSDRLGSATRVADINVDDHPKQILGSESS